jgi:hypothetical protein
MKRTTLGNLLVLAYVVGCAFQAVLLAGHLRARSLDQRGGSIQAAKVAQFLTAINIGGPFTFAGVDFN